MLWRVGSSERVFISSQCGTQETAYTDLNSVCYNSITEQGQMFWIATYEGGMEASLTCCPCCPFLPEFR